MLNCTWAFYLGVPLNHPSYQSILATKPMVTWGSHGIPHRNPSRRRLGLLLEEFLYAFHSGIEALAGSLLVIRGRGAMDTLQAWVGTR